MKNYAKITGINKFADSSVARQLDLSPFSVVYRNKWSKNTGVSTQSFGNFWFLTPKGQALFKTYDSSEYKAARNIRIINEMVCMELLESLGIPCATYEPAKFKLADSSAPELASAFAMREKTEPGISHKTHDGLVSYNFLSIGEELYPLGRVLDMDAYFEPPLETISEKLNILQDTGFKVSKRDIISSVYALSVFDFLTKQTDRNSNNLNVVIDEQRNVTPARVIDNEFAFFGQYFTSSNLKRSEVSLEEMTQYHDMFARHVTMREDHSECSPKRGAQTAKDIVAYACKHKELKAILSHIVKNIDIDTAVQKTREKGIEISPEYHEFMRAVIESSKTELINLMRMKTAKTTIDEFDELY